MWSSLMWINGFPTSWLGKPKIYFNYCIHSKHTKPSLTNLNEPLIRCIIALICINLAPILVWINAIFLISHLSVSKNGNLGTLTPQFSTSIYWYFALIFENFRMSTRFVGTFSGRHYICWHLGRKYFSKSIFRPYMVYHPFQKSV